MSRIDTRIIDAHALGAVDIAPADTDLHDLTSADFFDSTTAGAAAVAMAAGRPFSSLTIDNSASAGAVFVRFVALTAAGDATANRLQVAAGGIRTFGVRGVSTAASGLGTLTVSYALANGADVPFFSATFDRATA